jgi:nitrite reductase/ring-hydroxylating ferredoxin subunit
LHAWAEEIVMIVSATGGKTPPVSAPPEDPASALVDVAGGSEVPESTMKGFDVQGERVLVARVEGRLLAVGGLCTHQIAYLEDGFLDDGRVYCPRHGACFDLTSGEPLLAPADMPLPVYAVCERGGRILVSSRPVDPTTIRPAGRRGSG